jgi:hypothetical protein
MFYVFEGNASSSASLECCTVKLEQPFGQFPVGYTEVIQDGHRADQYPEVGQRIPISPPACHEGASGSRPM